MNRFDLIASVREMLERHWDVVDMASRLKVDVSVVQQIVDLLT